KYELQLARNSSFSNRKSFTLGEARLETEKLKPGTYYWRVRTLLLDGRRGRWGQVQSFKQIGANKLAGPPTAKPIPAPPTVSLPVKPKVVVRSKKIRLPAPIVSYPANKAIVDVKKQKLEWNEIKNSQQYLVEIYSYKNPKKPILVKESQKNSLTDLKLKPGKYFWRVASFSKDRVKSFSPKNTFIIKDIDALKSLEALRPDPTDRITTSQVATTVEFSWLSDKKADYYIIEASQTEEFLTTFFSTKVKGESSQFNFPQGTFYWKVSSYSKDGTLLKAGKVNTFSVVATMGKPKFYGDPVISKKLDKGTQVFDFSLTWSEIPRAERYEVELATDSAFEFVELTTTRIETDIPLTLQHGRFYARVKSVDIYGFGSDWSESKSIEITSSDLTRGPKLVLPKDQSNFVYRKNDSAISFKWKKAKNIVLYEIQISRDENFENIHFKLETPKTDLVKSFKMGAYHWRVRGVDNSGISTAWSDVNGFNLGLENSLLKLINPTDSMSAKQMIAQSGSTNFSWEAPKDVSKFKVIVARDRDFTDIISEKEVIGRKSASLDIDHQGETYWIVEGENVKERFKTKSATGRFFISSAPHWDPNGQIQISLGPQSTQYQESNASMFKAGLKVKYWFSGNFGVMLAYKAGTETLEDTSYLRSHAHLHLLGRRSFLAESSARFALTAALGIQQVTVPENTEPETKGSKLSLYSFGLSFHKPLSENWAAELEVFFASLISAEDLINTAQNMQLILSLQQKIADTWRLGYGFTYENLETASDESESSRKDQALELSIGKDF
ncbi:hypothetical protein N9D31_03260, partial [Oligoflexaceae bacterium]|nr:hypothetical protein [Oligoflexaceae bacterium]